MRYLGGGIGHRTAATDSESDPTVTPMEISGITEGDPDVEMNLEDVDKDTNSNDPHFHHVDDIEDPNEDDYMQDDVPHTQAEVGEQADELDDYDYRDTQGAEPESDPDHEEDLADLDSCDLGAEDGENDEYLDSDLEYE